MIVDSKQVPLKCLLMAKDISCLSLNQQEIKSLICLSHIGRHSIAQFSNEPYFELHTM